MRGLALMSVLITASAMPVAAQPVADRFLVIPFDNLGHEARIYWMAEASAILLSDNLTDSGRRAYSREDRLEAFERLQLPASASLSRATVIRLGRLVGASNVVIGSLQLAGSQITVHAQNVRLDTGRMEGDVTESGAIDDLFAIYDRLTSRLIGAPAVRGRHPSVQVFEDYVKGLLASSTPTKIGYLQAALKLDPGFDRARLALWAVNYEAGSSQASLVAATAVPESSPFYARARFSAALSLMQLKRLDDAFATLRTLADRSPSATLMNNLGVIQLRRPVTPQAGRPTYYFNEAIKLDAADPDYYFNLGYAYWLEHDAQGAVYWLREALRRRPADGDAHALLAAALQLMGAATESARERELATQLSAKPVDAASRGLERLKLTLDVSIEHLNTALSETGQRDQRELAAFHLDRGRRLFEQGNDAEATAELQRALYSSPYEAEAHLLLGRIHLRLGRTQAAIDAFKISLWSSETTAAHLALAQAYVQAKNETAARSEAQRALVLAPDSPEAKDAKELLSKLKP